MKTNALMLFTIPMALASLALSSVFVREGNQEASTLFLSSSILMLGFTLLFYGELAFIAAVAMTSATIGMLYSLGFDHGFILILSIIAFSLFAALWVENDTFIKSTPKNFRVFDVADHVLKQVITIIFVPEDHSLSSRAAYKAAQLTPLQHGKGGHVSGKGEPIIFSCPIHCTGPMYGKPTPLYIYSAIHWAFQEHKMIYISYDPDLSPIVKEYVQRLEEGERSLGRDNIILNEYYK